MKSVVITGAAGGLGRQLAAAFAKDGWCLGLMGHSHRAALDELAASLPAPTIATACCDIADADAVETVFAQFDDELGALDVLVHAAAVSPPGLIANMKPEEFDAGLAVNLTGAFHCMRAAIGRMLRRRDGHIITIGSYWGGHGLRGGCTYSASKAGLVGLRLAAAHEYGPRNIRCNVVLPGFMRTPMTAGIAEEHVARIAAKSLLGRISDLDEVCGFIVHLAGMRNVSAQVFNLDSRPGRL
jgi:3-oxoacyl-[acyl-carrier protein] reductase